MRYILPLVLAVIFASAIALAFLASPVVAQPDMPSYPMRYGFTLFTLFNLNQSAYCNPNSTLSPTNPLTCGTSSANKAQLWYINGDANDIANECYVVSPSYPAFITPDTDWIHWCQPYNRSYTNYGQDGDIYCYYPNWDDPPYVDWMQFEKYWGYYLATNYIYPSYDIFYIKNAITGKYCTGDAFGFHCNISASAKGQQAHSFIALFHQDGDGTGTSGSEYCDAY